MRACACALLAICTASGLTVRRREPHIQSNILEELPPLFIPCNLTDIVTISSPVLFNNNTLYFLYSPNNDVRKLNITMPIKQNHKENVEINGERTKHTKNVNNSLKFSNLANAYSIQNVNYRQAMDSKTEDVFGEKSNEIVIGPLGQDDHGNWVLSVYYVNNDSTIEMFQVITIQITEYVPVWSSSSSLHVGGTMELGFAYPIPDIETCELIIPTPTSQPFSYFREFSRTSLFTCSYIVPNLTVHDAGRWKIIGVGKTVYEGRVFVKLNDTGTYSGTNARFLPYPNYGLSSSSESIRFLNLLLLPTLGHILKMYY